MGVHLQFRRRTGGWRSSVARRGGGRGAAAFVSTQASTKVYRSPNGTQRALRARGSRRLVDSRARSCGVLRRLAIRSAPEIRPRSRRGAGRRRLGDVGTTRVGRTMGIRALLEPVSCVSTALVIHDALALRREEGPLAARLGRFDVLATVLIVGRIRRPARRWSTRCDAAGRAASGAAGGGVSPGSSATGIWLRAADRRTFGRGGGRHVADLFVVRAAAARGRSLGT